MKKFILLAFLIILSSLLGCAKQANTNKPGLNEQIQITPEVGVSTITGSVMPNKTGTEYEQLLSQYRDILLKYNETDISQFSDLDSEAMKKFQALLTYRESIAENYPGGYEICFDVPRTSGIRISFSEIYKTNNDNYRYVTYIPIGSISKVFIQVWNDDIFESAELLTVLQLPRAEYEVVDTRILSDDSGVYANILIEATDYSRYEHSYEMYTYKIESGTFTSYIPITENISVGNWTVEETIPFDENTVPYYSNLNVNTNILAVEIKCIKEKEISEWFNAGHGFEGNILTFFEVGGGNEFQLVFENGIWKKFTAM